MQKTKEVLVILFRHFGNSWGVHLQEVHRGSFCSTLNFGPKSYDRRYLIMNCFIIIFWLITTGI